MMLSEKEEGFISGLLFGLGIGIIIGYIIKNFVFTCS